MHNNQSSNTTMEVEMVGLGINNNSIKHYLNEVFEVGRGDSENDVAKQTGTNGIKQAVSIYYHNVRINLLTLYDSWKTKTERASRKLEELRQDIKNAKAIIDSLSHIRFFRGFLYAFMGILFFLGEVEFSKQTIISAWRMGHISIWFQAALVLALASTTGLCKLVYERFIEIRYNERDPNAYAARIRKFYFAVMGLVITVFLTIAYARGIIAKYQLLPLDGNVYQMLYTNHPYIQTLAYVVVALLFLIGSSILLPVGLKELSDLYKIKQTKKLIAKLNIREKELESNLDSCREYLNKYMYTIQFMDNKEEFNDYIENEIGFINNQYQRGMMKGVEIKEEVDNELSLDTESNNKITKELLPQLSLNENDYPIDDFHLRVRRDLDRIAQLQ